MRQHTNTAIQPTRRLSKKFDNAGTALGTTKAIPVNAPATFGGKEVAMGYTGYNGVVSFIHDGADQDFTLWVYNKRYEETVPASKGWVKGGGNANFHTQDTDGGAQQSFACQEGVLFFLQAQATPCDNVVVSGTEFPGNKNTDISNG